jgi:AbiV family abortive infection protein
LPACYQSPNRSLDYKEYSRGSPLASHGALDDEAQSARLSARVEKLKIQEKKLPTSGRVTAQSLLRGAAFSLEQCGLLLGDAKLLYESGSYATAVTVASFAREELGRWHMLHKLRKRVLDEGKSLTIKAVRDACDNHVRKQEAGMAGVILRANKDSGVAKRLQRHGKASPGSEERKEADKQVDEIVRRKSEHTPEHRHRLRMKALYVDIISGEQCNQPAREISQAAACECLGDARDAYEVQRQRYMDLSPELHDALVQWAGRPELRQVQAPSCPATG